MTTNSAPVCGRNTLDCNRDDCLTGDCALRPPPTRRGTWDDPAIINDPRIDHEDPTVRAVAEKLHGNESMHLHEYISSPICPYCALRTTRVIRWTRQHQAGEPMKHDTPFGLVQGGDEGG